MVNTEVIIHVGCKYCKFPHFSTFKILEIKMIVL